MTQRAVWSAHARVNYRALLTALLLAALPTVLGAAEPSHSAHAQPHRIPWGTLLFSGINFAIFVWLMRRAALPTLRAWVRERRERVRHELDEAARVRTEAERLRTEWEARVAQLEREIAEIRQQAAADAQRERDRILDAAKRAAAGIESDARRAAAHEIARAAAALREEIAREAIASAERLIRERVTPADHERFMDEFLREVPP